MHLCMLVPSIRQHHRHSSIIQKLEHIHVPLAACCFRGKSPFQHFIIPSCEIQNSVRIQVFDKSGNIKMWGGCGENHNKSLGKGM